MLCQTLETWGARLRFFRYPPKSGNSPVCGPSLRVSTAANRRSATRLVPSVRSAQIDMNTHETEEIISATGGSVVFDFRLGRGRDGPKRFLGQFEGILQTDGYAAYDQIGGTRMVHAACWGHARRQFFEAVQVNPRDPLATLIVARMDALFAVDAEARRRVIGLTGRHALRQERATPLLDDIRSKIEAAHSVALPSSALSKACQYALTLWRKLTRFLEYPELELSNNLAENSMRPVALGRKNWIHIDSPQAGPKVAAILSAVESCCRLNSGARLFRRGPPGFAGLPIARLPDLTPAAWVAHHS